MRCPACGAEGKPRTIEAKPKDLAIVYVEGEMRLGALPFPGATRPLDPTVKDLHGAELVKALQNRPKDPCQHLYAFKSSKPGRDYCPDCGADVPADAKLAPEDRSEQIRRQEHYRETLAKPAAQK